MITLSNFFNLIFYSISLILFFNFNRIFIFWMLTEINLLLFIGILLSFIGNTYKQEIFDIVLFYFIIQSLSSIFLLRDFFFFDNLVIFKLDIFFIGSILIKLGIFPFFYWVYKITDFLKSFNLWILLSLQKIPFFIFLFRRFDKNISVYMLRSLIFGSILIFFSKNFTQILVSSSIILRFLIFFMYEIRIFIYLLFFYFYTNFLFILITSYLKNGKFNLNLISNLNIYIFLLGLSPFSLFFFKFDLINSFFLNLGFWEVLFFFFFRFLSLFGYMSYSFKIFFSNLEPYVYSMEFEIKITFFLLRSLFFFFFILC